MCAEIYTIEGNGFAVSPAAGAYRHQIHQVFIYQNIAASIIVIWRQAKPLMTMRHVMHLSYISAGGGADLGFMPLFHDCIWDGGSSGCRASPA